MNNPHTTMTEHDKRTALKALIVEFVRTNGQLIIEGDRLSAGMRLQRQNYNA